MEIKRNPPLNIITFASIEHEQFLVSLANNKEELALLSHLQGLYEAALAHPDIGEDDAVLFQLLFFIHYHLLYSHTCLMRCHLSEAFGSARMAIDAALAAAVIIHDRSKQVEYATGQPPFGGILNRHLRKLVKEGKPLPHPHVPSLLELYGKLSTFTNHADVGSFAHRTSINKLNPAQDFLSIQYFQFAENKTERQIHAYTLLHEFVMVLDVFTDFLVTEKKLLPQEWADELHRLGKHIEIHAKTLKAKLDAENRQASVEADEAAE